MALLSPGDLLDRAAPFLVEAGIELPGPGSEREWWAAAAVLAGGGGRRLTDLATRLHELVSPSWDGLFEANAKVRDDEEALAVVGAFAESSRAGELDSEEAYLDAASRVRDATGASGRRLFHPLRLAISGRDSGPELKQLIPLLEAGARLAIEPAVAGIAERIDRALGSRRT
jgi:glutamyl/glutaminyl-tRNA synthetase